MPAEIDVAIIGAGKLEHLHEAVTTGKALAVLAAYVFYFGEISIPEARQYLKDRGIPVTIGRTSSTNRSGN